MKKIAIVGNPNCGKTTIFNAITGSNQKVGNWSGVTVDKKSGYFQCGKDKTELVDLPGLYSITSSDENSLDEQVASKFLINEKPELVINVIDASNFERHMYLTMQLLEMKVPVVLAVNMIDVAKARGMIIHFDKLAKKLNIPVVPVIGRKQVGIKDLIDTVDKTINDQALPVPFDVYSTYNEKIQKFISDVTSDESGLRKEKWFAIRLLENDSFAIENSHQPQLTKKANAQLDNNVSNIDVSIVRYECITMLVEECCDIKLIKKHRVTNIVDTICLNKYLGIPIFLFVMYMMFEFSINIGGALQPLFDNSSRVIFMDGLSHLLLNIGLPTWITAVLANGVGLGINTVITFIPQIGCMFIFLCFLEDSGYMARAAFVMDRFMQWVGLPGKSFVPLIVGFGCNVPAVMATRTLESRRDRLLTIMMSPFISCGARLAIFAVFAAAFFGEHGAGVVFLLYLVGIVAAIVTGLVVKHTILKGDNSPFILELPTYHMPNFKTIIVQAWNRLKRFITRAGKVIIPVCILIGALNSIQVNGQLSSSADGSRDSVLSKAGEIITPVFEPMGIKSENWPATVGLLTGVLAKEVVIGTLNTLYTQNSGDSGVDENQPFHFWAELKGSVTDTLGNFQDMSIGTFINPFTANEADAHMDKSVMGTMAAGFGSVAAAFAYLLFVLLYVPCVATIGAMSREAGKGWAWLSVIWSTSIAYVLAVVAYQVTNLVADPVYACVAIGLSLLYMTILIGLMKYYSEKIRFSPKFAGGCGTDSGCSTGGCH
ncbi:Fe(2+) transporter permease subunit FeoB [Francisellaceae bacterium]|nr:Fe(2+) transporter permease subunit FeoB [Francisellaceae bacterium]